MSFNFCCDDFVSSIVCDKTCFDGHEVGNLVARRGIHLNKGFISDHYIKPPVSITLKFICRVNVNNILLKTFVGSQRSVSFELFTVGLNGKGRIGSLYEANSANYIVFHIFGDNNLQNKYSQTRSSVNVPFDCPNRLKGVDKLVLKIVKTCNSSVPCLGQLEVWGDPSNSVPRDIVNYLNTKWALFLKPLPTPATSPLTQNSETDSSQLLQNLPKVLADDIPEEFIDPISCEIMLCPMVLPSGKIVDRTTLDKFYAAEEEWGRGHSDPFSGLPFSNFRKPLLATALKAKIDKYLVFHANNDLIKKMPRIIGRAPTLSIPGISPPAKFVRVEEGSSSNHIASNTNLYSNNNSCGPSNLFRRTKRSLDELIDDSLNGLPSYINMKKPRADTVPNCAVCKTLICLFKLPCLHLICRGCLLKIPAESHAVCMDCGRSFTSSDPERFHNPCL